MVILSSRQSGYCTSLAQGVYGSRVAAEALIDQVIISNTR
jgi:hypothetical protein